MTEARTCPKCGEPLAADMLTGLCPKCVARALLAGPVPEAVPGQSASPLHIRYFGDYELLEEIGRGGMGVVFKARQVSLNRLVAVKMLLHGGFASEEFVKRFQTEAEAAASLQHPNIVAIHEVGVHEGLHYFSMDYVEGPNLAELVRDQPLPAKSAARHVQLIAEATHYAHQRGILHRDLKPSNVLIDPSDQPRITDFGLAKRLASASDIGHRTSDLTLTGQVLGAPSYMPPEQALGKRGQVGVTSDVYALGAILYHLLTGKPPFLADTPQETLVQVQTREPRPPRQLNPAIPRDLEVICLKCLRKDSRDRYDSAAALAEDLRRWQAGEPIVARPLGVAGQLWRRCRKRPVAAALLGTFVLALMVLLKPRLGTLETPRSAGGARPHNAPGATNLVINWTSGPDMLEGYHEVRAAVLEGKLYVVGGRTGHGTNHHCVSTVQVYDPDTGRWSRMRPLPEPLAAVGLAVHKGQLYCFGGIREAFWWGWPVASAYRFDPSTQEWTRLPPMPIARSNFATGVLAGRIYCAGGNIHWPNATDRIDIYDPALNQWLEPGSMPQQRGSCTGGPWRDMFVIAPGFTNTQHSATDHNAPVDQGVLGLDPALRLATRLSSAQGPFLQDANYLFSDYWGIYLFAYPSVCRLQVETGQMDFFWEPVHMSCSSPVAAYDPSGATVYMVGGVDTDDHPLRALWKGQIRPSGGQAR
jgi:hypothetical protein